MNEYTRHHDPDLITSSEDDAGTRRQARGRSASEGRDVERHALPPVPVASPAALPPRQGFWGRLTENEQGALLAIAAEAVYPVGTTLWSEGQTADQAVVIRSGSVRVSVNRDGHERLIAFRGPGDIIGERAALMLRLRSATVVAMGTVHGLRMTTQQFAVYLSDHPRVVAVLEREVYERLTEPPDHAPLAPQPYGHATPYGPGTQHGYAVHHGYASQAGYDGQNGYDGQYGGSQPYAAASAQSAHVQSAGHGRHADATGAQGRFVPASGALYEDEPTQPMVVGRQPGPAGTSWTGQNCTIVFTDIAGFSESHRNDVDRLEMRRAMRALLREAFEESGVPWDACHIEDRGDGALIVVPPEVPTAAVIDPMIASLAIRLHRHNERSRNAVRIQLRVAAHVGPVMPDPPGVSGWALIRTARLLDARPLKDRLAATGADLGFIASTFVYESVIAHGPGHVNPAEYELISCMVKKLKTEGWIYLSKAAAGTHRHRLHADGPPTS